MKHSTIDWAPFIPNDWEEKRIKDISHLQSGNGITSDDIDHIGLYPVYGGNGLRGYTDNYTNDGDYVLIGRQGALCGNINYAKDKFYASEHAVVVYPYCKDENTIWLGETLRAANLNRLSASAAQPGLAVSALNFVKIPYPPESQRERIGEYLDEKCGEIDGQVALLEKKRDAYARLKVSVINKAVTHGLNPDVSMRPSGIDWIGDIPAHWNVKRIKDLGSLGSGTTPKSGSDAYYDDGIHPWLNTGCVQNCIINQPAKYVTELAMKECPGLRYYPKDTILVAMYGGGTIGNVGLMGFDATINQACCAIELSTPHLPKYMFYAIMAQNAKLISYGFGGTQINLSQGQIANFLLAVPPLAEQRAIADYLDKKCGEIDAAVENLDKQINAYKRLKKSLINEVVTGKRAV